MKLFTSLMLAIVFLSVVSTGYSQDEAIEVRTVTTTYEITERFIGDRLIDDKPIKRQIGQPVIKVEKLLTFDYDAETCWIVLDSQKQEISAIAPGKFTVTSPGTYQVFASEPMFETRIVEPNKSDYQDLQNLSRDLAKMVGDRQHAIKYLAELEKVSFAGDMASVKRAIGQARANASRGGVTGQWYKFFQPLDQELGKAQTVEEYAAMWTAVMQGLKETIDSTPSPQFNDYLPPVGTVVYPILQSTR